MFVRTRAHPILLHFMFLRPSTIVLFCRMHFIAKRREVDRRRASAGSDQYFYDKNFVYNVNCSFKPGSLFQRVRVQYILFTRSLANQKLPTLRPFPLQYNGFRLSAWVFLDLYLNKGFEKIKKKESGNQ